MSRTRKIPITSVPMYNTWREIKKRCYSPKSPVYAYYGARGIAMFEEWKSSFPAFAAYIKSSLGSKPTEFHTLDRINNDGNYEPGNLRWATRSEQQHNTRQNVWLEMGGVSMTSTDWARKLGINPCTLAQRRRQGWTMPELLMPVGFRRAKR